MPGNGDKTACGRASVSSAERILNDRRQRRERRSERPARLDPESGALSRPNHGRSIVEILITVVPFVLLWLSMWLSLHLGYGLYLLLAIPAAGFLVRLFMIQHDCGHGSFFRHRLLNDWVGRVIGVLTLTPYDFWRHTHGIHHATSGNLDRRGIGDIDTLTVREYLALPRWRRLRLSPLPPSDRHVRRRSDLSVHPAPPAAVRPDCGRAGRRGSAPWRPMARSRLSLPA